MGRSRPAESFPHVANDDPMMASVAGRYASAMFDLVKEQGSIPAVERDLANVQALYDGSPEFQRLIRSPVFSADEQTNALTAILTKMGASPVTGNFFKLLARNRRLFAAPEMMKHFRTLVARSKGIVEAEVTSAHALTADQMATLKQTLKANVGKDVDLRATVDPSLLGGLVVRMGSRMIDSSLKTKLSNLKIAMKGAN